MALAIATQPAGIINARTPIFYKFTGLNISYDYSIVVYINGLEYITIDRSPNNSSQIIIDIHVILNDYLRNLTSHLTYNTIYVYCKLNEYDTGTLNGSITSNTVRCVLGYTTYENGINYSYGDIYKATSDPEIIYLPNYGDNDYNITYMNTDGSGGNMELIYTNSGGTLSTKTEVFSNDSFQPIRVGFTYLYNTLNIDINKPIKLNVYSGTTLLNTTNIIPFACNGNDLNNITFINKYGVWDKIFITGKVIKSLSADYETYKYNNLNYSTMSYSNKGSYHKFLDNGKNSLIINTGWFSEGLNDKLEEIFLSEMVYYNSKPIILTSKDVQFKTHRYDKLINYTINADYAYDKINNIK